MQATSGELLIRDDNILNKMNREVGIKEPPPAGP